ncbi:MAG: CaiB/BaiF CoA-transferase family protein [Roseovarius sp.]|nr:CaiB/BaiF CoA-transferase family protein [Roseovarius sp.]MCY4206473.1 CaiB/BaiF CoA-transferase family protein [Roseovarius sp.]MCY4292954.1 CaiB/BaiF CoA-transferase family protein [Roseovarius sp.]MCY4316415.1 CaiB/BaiF CoA-transferase family protein [Roseovarius sp.]
MLDTIKVVEIEGLGPGPFAAMMLADLGAEVTAIHRPDPSSPATGGHSMLDRGKRSVVLDLKSGTGLQAARALINRADAVIEGFRPGVMERLGLGPETFSQSNPALVFARMTGWGQSGPRSGTAGHDLNYIATSGALHYASAPGDIPMTPPTMLGDIAGGALYLVSGILAGLINAKRSGRGTVVDAAIVDGSAHMMALLMSMAPGGDLRERRGESLLDGPHWSRVYACRCGGFLSVQCLEPKFYSEFLSIMDLDGDPDFKNQHDRSKWPGLVALLAKLFASKPIDHWVDLFENSDACVAPVLSPWKAASEPHIAERGIWVEFQGMLQPVPAPRFDGKCREPGQIPLRGQHTEAILNELRAEGKIDSGNI